MLDENRVLNRLMTGDTSAAEDVVNEFEAPIYQYCLQFLGSAKEAETAVIESFLRLFAQLGPDVKETSLRDWLIRIMINVCMDQQRHHLGRAKERKGEELTDMIHNALQRVVRQQRTILLLRDLIGLEMHEICSVLEIDEHTAMIRLSRARSNLCDFLLQAGAELGGTVNRKKAKEHQVFVELCSRYVDENVTKEEKSLLMDHIQKCDFCAIYLQNLTKVGRGLEQLAKGKMPDTLKETTLQAVREQAEKSQRSLLLRMRMPLFTMMAFAAAVVLLVCSGLGSGMFINTSNPHYETQMAGSASFDETPKGLGFDEMTIPENVSANSYAFAIVAVGSKALPQLSTEAELIAVEENGRAAFYLVNSDVAAAERLVKSLDTFGYDAVSITDNRIKVSGNAPHGLIAVMTQES